MMTKGIKIIFFNVLIAAAILALFYENLILALLLMFLSPGYVFLSAVFFRSSQINDRVLLFASVGVSSVFSGLLGLINTYFLHWEIKWILSGWTIVLGLYVLSMILQEEAPTIQDESKAAKAVVDGWTVVKLLVVTAGIGVGLYILVPAILKPPQFTQFFLKPADQTESSLPDKIDLNEPLLFSVGILNHNEPSSEYTIVVYVNGEVDQVLHPIIVEDNELLEVEIGVEDLRLEEDQSIEIVLGNAAQGFPYRVLRFWLDVVNND